MKTWLMINQNKSEGPSIIAFIWADVGLGFKGNCPTRPDMV